MPRSAKQLAFFKKIVDEAGLCGQSGGHDVFDSAIRMARAVKSAKSFRDRLRATRGKRFQDTFARKHGFKTYVELLASDWQPFHTENERRKKVKSYQRNTKVKPKKAGYKKKAEDQKWRKDYVDDREFHNAM